jgi:tetratricopeptide (TPR) repeat protein
MKLSELGQDLMVCHYKLGNLEQQQDHFAAAVKHYERGLSVLKTFVEAQHVRVFDQEIGELERRIGFCRTAEKVVHDVEFALSLPIDVAPSALLFRSAVLARRGDLVQAAETAAKLRELEPKNADRLYLAARSYALIAAAAGRGKTKLSGDEQTARQQYADVALATLREALAAGFNDFDQLEKDADLAVLRELPAYKELLPK